MSQAVYMELLLSACMIHGSVSKVYAKSKKKIMIGHGTVGEKGKTPYHRDLNNTKMLRPEGDSDRYE